LHNPGKQNGALKRLAALGEVMQRHDSSGN
jgi:hypothetical protein